MNFVRCLASFSARLLGPLHCSTDSRRRHFFMTRRTMPVEPVPGDWALQGGRLLRSASHQSKTADTKPCHLVYPARSPLLAWHHQPPRTLVPAQHTPVFPVGEQNHPV